MTRIAYRTLEQMSGPARELTVERGNLNVYRALANAENTFTGWMLAGRAALTSTVLPARLRELVILRVGYLMDSPYEIAQHGALAHTVGIGDQEIAALSNRTAWESTSFDDIELAALRLTTELVATGEVTPQVFDEVHQRLGAEGTVEVLMLINRWSGLALMLNALDVDIDDAARISVPPADATQ
jgi:alkylhydroperoxidase family enzyme